MGARALSEADERKNLALIDRAPTGTGRSEAHEGREKKANGKGRGEPEERWTRGGFVAAAERGERKNGG